VFSKKKQRYENTKKHRAVKVDYKKVLG